jgi:apolipoprotein N-acyltransferase
MPPETITPVERRLAAADAYLKSAADAVRSLRGWRRNGAALCAGAAVALAFAPYYALPLLALGFSALVLLVDASADRPRPLRAAFAAGWFFGFGFFVVSLYWLAFSFFVQAEEFAWMAPFAVTGLPAFLALFTGAACAVAAALRRRGAQRLFAFAAIYMTFEYARGHVLTGLPWNLPGQALAGTAVGAQTAAWYGVYGLSLVVVLLAVLPARAADGAGLRGVCQSVLGFAALYLVGAARLLAPDPGIEPDTFVRIVQPNIPQREKIDGDLWADNFLRHVALSTGETAGSRLFVVWPENAAPYLQEQPAALEVLARELPQQAILLAGTVRREADGARDRYYNSLGVFQRISGALSPVAYYDKHHLAPFGEYLPLQGLLRAVGLAQLAPYDDGFAFGAGPQVIDSVGPAFAPLICYETIFPAEIHPRGERPAWLATVTNDAWFGDTAGPRQHFDQARLRSIETGLPMVRAANTGISAIIDARGRILHRIGLYRAGRIDAPLPKPIAPTLYARVGDSLFAVLLIGFLVLAGRVAGQTGGPARGAPETATFARRP